MRKPLKGWRIRLSWNRQGHFVTEWDLAVKIAFAMAEEAGHCDVEVNAAIKDGGRYKDGEVVMTLAGKKKRLAA